MNANILPLRRPLQLSTFLLLASQWLAARAEQLELRRRRMQDQAVLSTMSDQALSDLGIGRDQIGWLMETDGQRAPGKTP